MSTATERLAKPGKASVKMAAFNMLRGISFATVQILAALALDGWLSVACAVMAGYNITIMVIVICGWALVAVDVMNKTEAAR